MIINTFDSESLFLEKKFCFENVSNLAQDKQIHLLFFKWSASEVKVLNYSPIGVFITSLQFEKPFGLFTVVLRNHIND